MRKYTVLFVLAGIFGFSTTYAQYGYGMRPHRHPSNRYPVYNLPPFKPTVLLSFGYGLPNLDKDQMLLFSDHYQGKVQQTGPIFGSIDYQFNRTTSIGAAVSYGKVSSPYYDYNGNPDPDLYGKLEDWSIMLDMVRYMPLSKTVSPYLKTSVGVSMWNENYTDSYGNKVVFGDNPGMFAYQISVGARFDVASQTGLFIEAGYGKYILAGGLSFKL